ncbi:MAG: hypothetical protein HQM10_08255 [Candidatus Riflebacteria bacterium]|nr:hypothetical protein [Candidatus Riflebacteria bacterium]
MICTKITDFFEKNDARSVSELPLELRKHAESCPDCMGHLSFVGQLKKQASRFEPSQKEMAEAKAILFQKISRQATFTENPPSSKNIIIVISTVIILAIGAAYYLTGSRLPENPGKSDSAIQPPVKQQIFVNLIPAVPGKAINCSEKAILEYPDGGKININGQANIVLAKNGFDVKEGNFTAVFKRGTNVIKIRTTTVVLGIIGTTVNFQIASGSGKITLIEGVVVAERIIDGYSFTMKAGDVIDVKSGIGTAVKSATVSQPITKTASEAHSGVRSDTGLNVLTDVFTSSSTGTLHESSGETHISSGTELETALDTGLETDADTGTGVGSECITGTSEVADPENIFNSLPGQGETSQDSKSHD